MTKYDVLDFITDRRSIRKYTEEPVSEEDILMILKAAMSAPSASNLKPWNFIVIKERETLDKIADFHPYGKMLKEAPLAIAVVGNTKCSDYWVQDCSACTQNILLASTGMGLGSVWLGIYPREERVKAGKELLSIPDGWIILSIVSIGHPSMKSPGRTQFEEIRIHREKWSI